MFGPHPSYTWGSINGGGGNDTLDYSHFSSGVYVDLAIGRIPTVTEGAVFNIENATGSTYHADTLRGNAGANVLSGLGGNDRIFGGGGNDTLNGGNDHDILFGQDGNDTMYGLSGRDILFGGYGADAMNGGLDDDILGSGTTIYENGGKDLSAIQAEWLSNRSYSDRVRNLRGDSTSPTFGSRVNGNSFLTTQRSNRTVALPPAAEDQMTGGSGADWFFGYAAEYISEPGEYVN